MHQFPETLDANRTRGLRGQQQSKEQNFLDGFSPTSSAAHGRWQNAQIRPENAPEYAATYGDSQDHRQATATLTVSPGAYSPGICDSPPTYHTPESSTSGESMHAHVGNATPPASPFKQDSSGASIPQIAQLSLNQTSLPENTSARLHGRGHLSAVPVTVGKRAASSELSRPPDRRFTPGRPVHSTSQATGGRRSKAARAPPKIGNHAQQFEPRISTGEDDHADCQEPVTWPTVRDSATYGDYKAARPLPRDSGYDSLPPSIAVLQSGQSNSNNSRKPLGAGPTVIEEHSQNQMQSNRRGIVHVSAKPKYPGLILQPDSSPISQDQLAAEVKGIYAGLVMVEAKCINVDAAQAADQLSQLGPEQWQALIALHRTLLYEHHDFLMATQHPSATPALRNLATKYTMPARMWKHGIHAFLEVLRHRRPESQDFMLAFIYLAYQMMALLFETVPSFIDTWIECLGDLARYRMAIEEEKEAHAQWGAVAARWYTMASDRHPAIGRLNHHLGILERPSLRKLFLYAKALTCVIPFSNARDSLSTLCAPIISDEQAIKNSSQSAEARIVTFHALIYSTPTRAAIENIARDAVRLWEALPSVKKRDLGVPLAVSNIAALLDLGNPNTRLWQAYMAAVTRSIRGARPSINTNTSTTASDADLLPDAQNITTTTVGDAVYSLRKSFCYACFNSVLRRYEDRIPLRDTLPFVHIMLGWLHSLTSLHSRLNDSPLTIYMCGTLLGHSVIAWGGLCDYLNSLAYHEQPISARTVEFARQGNFPGPERKDDAKPLSEDFLIRGLVWSQWYFGSGWFDGHLDFEDGRTIETPSTQKVRVERVQWLGLYLAFHTEYLRFDPQKKLFSTPVVGTPQLLCEVVVSTPQEPVAGVLTPASRTSSTPPASSEADDGFTMVTAPKAKKPIRSWASIAAKQQSKPTKGRQDYSNVKVVGEDSMELES